MEPKQQDQTLSVFVTEAKEYTVRGKTCLRLRDRRTGRFEPVLANRLLGAVPPAPEHYLCETSEPRVGDRLCIQMGSRYLVSTPILAVERASPSPATPSPTRERVRART